MRVLDPGSGAGDVALLVARFVGLQGSVLGVERSAEASPRCGYFTARGSVIISVVLGCCALPRLGPINDLAEGSPAWTRITVRCVLTEEPSY
jgi:hypothetical protein